MSSLEQQDYKAMVEGEVSDHEYLSIVRVRDIPTKAEEVVVPHSLCGKIWVRSGCLEQPNARNESSNCPSDQRVGSL